jgi:hypothetical protein
MKAWSDFKITSRTIAVIARVKKTRKFFPAPLRRRSSTGPIRQNAVRVAGRQGVVSGARFRRRTHFAPASARAGLALEALAIEAILGAVPAAAARLAGGAVAQALALDGLGAALVRARRRLEHAGLRRLARAAKVEARAGATGEAAEVAAGAGVKGAGRRRAGLAGGIEERLARRRRGHRRRALRRSAAATSARGAGGSRPCGRDRPDGGIPGRDRPRATGPPGGRTCGHQPEDCGHEREALPVVHRVEPSSAAWTTPPPAARGGYELACLAW